MLCAHSILLQTTRNNAAADGYACAHSREGIVGIGGSRMKSAARASFPVAQALCLDWFGPGS